MPMAVAMTVPVPVTMPMTVPMAMAVAVTRFRFRDADRHDREAAKRGQQPAPARENIVAHVFSFDALRHPPPIGRGSGEPRMNQSRLRPRLAAGSHRRRFGHDEHVNLCRFATDNQPQVAAGLLLHVQNKNIKGTCRAKG
ncbi:MAG: hypothetical protein J0H01_21005 [Rhizobiales bacterium]|nr:hypothetical protein [Hyphomicrobiales bacterium]